MKKEEKWHCLSQQQNGLRLRQPRKKKNNLPQLPWIFIAVLSCGFHTLQLRLILSYGWLEFWGLNTSCGWFCPAADSSSGGWIRVAAVSSSDGWIHITAASILRLTWVSAVDTSCGWFHPPADSSFGGWIRIVADSSSYDWPEFRRLDTSYSWFHRPADYELRLILSCGWLEFRRLDLTCGWLILFFFYSLFIVYVKYLQ